MLALSFMRTSTILFFVTILTYAVLLIAVVDTFLMWRGLKKKLAAKFGDEAAAAKGNGDVRRDARLPAAPVADAARARQARRVPRLSAPSRQRPPTGPSGAGSRLIGP